MRVNGFCSPKGRAPRKEARAETGAIALPCAPRGWTVPVRGPWGAERTGSVSAPGLRPLGERRLPRTWPLSTWRRFQGSPVPQEGRPPPPSLPDPSSLPFHGTRTSPEPVAPGAGFLAVGERRRGGLSENPALEASSSQARPRKALTLSLTRRAPVRGGARPGGFGGCHTVVRNLKGTAALPYQTNSWHTEQKVGWGKKVAVNSWHLTWCTLACLMAPRRWCRAKRPSVSNSLASFASAEEQRGRG